MKNMNSATIGKSEFIEDHISLVKVIDSFTINNAIDDYFNDFITTGSVYIPEINKYTDDIIVCPLCGEKMTVEQAYNGSYYDNNVWFGYPACTDCEIDLSYELDPFYNDPDNEYNNFTEIQYNEAMAKEDGLTIHSLY